LGGTDPDLLAVVRVDDGHDLPDAGEHRLRELGQRVVEVRPEVLCSEP
jgi:hypothetical protein